MEEKYESLFTPWKIGNVSIKNRFVMLPMEGTNLIDWQAVKGANTKAKQFYEDRCKAGVGLFIPGAIPVVTIVGRKYVGDQRKLFNEVKPIIEMIHSYGSKIFFQFTAGVGRSLPMPKMMANLINNKALALLTKPIVNMKDWNVAPDKDEPNRWNPDVKTRQFTVKQIHQFVHAFGQAALRSKEIGVDGVEIHAVHEGYLLDQFAMPYTNHRNDEYGGSLENRLRFACEIVQEIHRVCGNDYPVSLRFSVVSRTKGFGEGCVPGEKYKEVGRTLEESKKAVKILEDAGYDCFDCDEGTYDAWYWAHPPVYMPLNCDLTDIEAIKPFTSKPIIACGRLQPLEAASSISEKRIDGYGLGRQLLCDPDFPKKIEEGKLEEIRPCIACHASCLPMAHVKGEGAIIDFAHLEMGRCALNPYTNEETHYRLDKSSHPCSIAVIGGGIGGMEVAIEAAKRGHKVELYEKSSRLGGVFNEAAAPSFKEKDRELLAYYSHELKESGTKVYLNTEVKDVSSLKADHIVIATGAKARTLQIKGDNATLTAIDYLDGRPVGDNVAIIGGGLTGCEIAYDLAKKGKHPFIVEMLPDILSSRGIPAANNWNLRALISYYKIPCFLSSSVIERNGDSLKIKTGDKISSVPVNNLIVSIGYISSPLSHDLNDSRIHVIGDANKVGNLKSVIKEAYDLVQTISY